jgi:hypothetical protein
MRLARGHSIPEYALVLALVVLVSIPAVAFLGTTTSQFFWQNGDLSKADRLFSLLDVEAPGGANGPGSPGPGDTTNPYDAFDQLGQSGGPVVMRMNNNALELLLPSGAAISLDNTGGVGGEMSVMTTMVLSDQLYALADEFEGEVDDSLLAMIRNTATAGHQLAASEERFNQAEPWDQQGLRSEYCSANPCQGGPGGWNTPAREEVYNAHWLFTDRHQLLITTMKSRGLDPASGEFTDPAMARLYKKLNIYGEGIDTVADKNYTYAISSDGQTMGKTQLNINSGEYVDVSGITMDIAPRFTEATSDKIADSRPVVSGP